MQFRKCQLTTLKDLETVILALVIDQKDTDLTGIIGTDLDGPDTVIQSLCGIVDRNDDGDLGIYLGLNDLFARLGSAEQQQKETADRRYGFHQDRNDDPCPPEYERM
jgi:hypothetical protein